MTDKITIERETLDDALDRMDALLDPKAGLLTVGYDSATAMASRRDMQIIRAAVAAQPAEPVAWVDPATLARLTPENMVTATLVGKALNRFTAPLYAAPPAPAAVPLFVASTTQRPCSYVCDIGEVCRRCGQVHGEPIFPAAGDKP